MTQKELGSLLSVRDTAISAYENGDTYPSVDNLVKLSELGRVSIGWLIMGLDNGTPLDRILTADELKLLYEYRKASEVMRNKIIKIVELIADDTTE